MQHPSAKLIILVLLFLFPFTSSFAQSSPTLQCGQIFEAELISKVKVQSYTIQVGAGATLTIRVEPIGSTLNPVFSLRDASNDEIVNVNNEVEGLAEQLKDVVISSSNPVIWIGGAGKGRTGNWPVGNDSSQSLGAYTLSITCTLRDGTIIKAGDSAPPPQPPGNGSSAVPFSGVGFPGLAPVDFAAATIKPATLNAPIIGAVAPEGITILGYTFDAAATDNLALSFTRLSGNLNLGLVVLSGDNKVVFQASLVTSSELTTKFTLPTAGTYTIGIFRIDLLPPDAPEATAFQLTATLNP